MDFDLEGLGGQYSAFVAAFGSGVPYLVLLALFPVAALQRWIFRDRLDSAAECYVFLLFMYSQLFALSTIAILTGRYDTLAGLGLTAFVAVCYLSWGVSGFYSVRIHVAIATGLMLFALTELIGIGIGLSGLALLGRWP